MDFQERLMPVVPFARRYVNVTVKEMMNVTKIGKSANLIFFSSRRRHTRYWRDWSSDVCSSDLTIPVSMSGSLRDPDIETGMVRLQMLDYAGRLRDHLTVVDQHREFGERPQPLELGVIGLVFRDLTVFERSPIRPDRDQCFPTIAAEWVDVEFQAHQSPALIFSRSSSSASLGSLVANVPVSTSPFGS